MRFKDGQPCFLSKLFYETHPHELFPEIEAKQNRPHVMYLIEANDGTWFAIPLRSNIRHRFCFRINGGGGLDYTKAVPLLAPWFVDTKRKAMVRQSDWPLIQSNRARIKRGMERFVEQYRKAKQHPKRPGNTNLIRIQHSSISSKSLAWSNSRQMGFPSMPNCKYRAWRSQPLVAFPLRTVLLPLAPY